MNTQLKCRRLTKRYGNVTAVTDFSYDFLTSGIVGLIGPNGAGKTTLLNMLTGFEVADKGECYLGSRRITNLKPYQMARLGIARTFQEPRHMWDESVFDNILLGRPDQSGERLLRSLCPLGINEEEKINKEKAAAILSAIGLENEKNRPANNLSYGQQKLLAIARCLATEANIYLLDEPVAGVHSESSARILQLLHELRGQGKLVVFCEHDIEAVRQVSDQVIVLDEGIVVAHGSPTEVLDRPEILETYIV